MASQWQCNAVWLYREVAVRTVVFVIASVLRKIIIKKCLNAMHISSDTKVARCAIIHHVIIVVCTCVNFYDTIGERTISTP